MTKRRINVIPGRWLIAACLAGGLLGLVLFFLEFRGVPVPGEPESALLGLIFVLGAAAVLDWWRGRREKVPVVEREVPGSVAVDRWFEVRLAVHHELTRDLEVQLYEHFPGTVQTQEMPLPIKLKPGSVSRTAYRAKAVVRGDLAVPGCRLRIPSRWGFWYFYRDLPVPASLRVYPDFSAISAYSLLAMDNHTSQIGIRKRQRRGEGTEFHQLREYRQGDSLRQIDWKATSRRSKIVSRDYADERDQEIVLLLDSGRRMRAKDDDLSHFDHSLNALLLVSYIALRQGDSVSALSFGGSCRWVPPQKGAGRVQTILNAVYDLDAGRTAADYIAAAQRLVTLQPKRALVMLVSNCRDEDVDELLMAVNLLRRRHLVLLANLREEALDQRLREPVETFEDALTYAGVTSYLASRANVQQHLESQGVLVLDCTPRNLAARMANAYLEIKRAGIL